MDKIKFAVIGVGGIGQHHIKGIIDNSNAELTALCDNNSEILDSVCESYGIENRYADYHGLLDKDIIDAVCIATPDQIHREMVVDFLNAGINVLCEKPLALNSDDCRKMLDAESKSSAKLMVGQVCRKTPGFIKAKEIVDSKMIGELLFVESEYAHDYSEMPLHWRNDKNNPRHPVTGGGCHAVDLLRWIAGNPIDAYALSNKKALSDEWPCDDSAITVLRFPDNVMGKVFVSTGCKRDYTMRTVIYGTKGTIITDNTNSAMSLYLEEFEGKRELFGAKMKEIALRIPVVINNHNVSAEVNDFVDVLLGKKELDIPGAEGAATVAVCEAIIKSAQSGKAEKIDYISLD